MSQIWVTENGERLVLPGRSALRVSSIELDEMTKAFLEVTKRMEEEVLKALMAGIPPLNEGGATASDYAIIAAPCAVSVSEMNWDEEEMVTQPGVGPAHPQETATSMTFSGQYPQVSAEGLEKGTRCYLCGTQKFVTFFSRSPSDTIKVCVACLYHHLGWELQRDGSLTPVTHE